MVNRAIMMHALNNALAREHAEVKKAHAFRKPVHHLTPLGILNLWSVIGFIFFIALCMLMAG